MFINNRRCSLTNSAHWAPALILLFISVSTAFSKMSLAEIVQINTIADTGCEQPCQPCTAQAVWISLLWDWFIHLTKSLKPNSKPQIHQPLFTTGPTLNLKHFRRQGAVTLSTWLQTKCQPPLDKHSIGPSVTFLLLMPLAILMAQPSHLCAEIAGRAKGSSDAERKSEWVHLSAALLSILFRRWDAASYRQSHTHLLNNPLTTCSCVLGQHTKDLELLSETQGLCSG